MTMEAPDFFDVKRAAEAHAATAAGADATEHLRELARAGRVVRVDAPSELRSFLSPTHPNAKFLVRAGSVNYAPYQTAALGLRPAIDRTGDIWARFSSGVCATSDPDVIAWCEAHTGDPAAHRAYHEGHGDDTRNCGAPIGLCREKGPHIDDWYKMKLAQVPLKHRPIGLDPDIDVDAYVLGHIARESASRPATQGISAVVEANENAARERADGKRN